MSLFRERWLSHLQTTHARETCQLVTSQVIILLTNLHEILYTFQPLWWNINALHLLLPHFQEEMKLNNCGGHTFSICVHLYFPFFIKFNIYLSLKTTHNRSNKNEIGHTHIPVTFNTKFNWNSLSNLGWNKWTYIRFELVTAVVMKSIFWDVTPCSLLIVNLRFGGISPPFSVSKNKPS
jgi:hypothetical protein